MSLFVVFGIAVGLALDAFAVAGASSIALGNVTKRQVFRLGFHFGLFQAMMPVVGWLAGRSIHGYMHRWDHWVAFGLLSLIGGRAIHAAMKQEERTSVSDPTRGLSLIMLSTATSIDALAVGLSFAMLEVGVWYPCVVIGLVTCGLTVVGMLLGSRIGLRFGRRAEIAGGLVLIVIGVKILAEHIAKGI